MSTPAPITTPVTSSTRRCFNPPFCHEETKYTVTMIDLQAFACVTHIANVQSLVAARASGDSAVQK
jgi:hypothetical protein